jgi:sterol desaturase/sphingolipid hydroxylase (fatty acid hydroxylase superfamily)
VIIFESLLVFTAQFQHSSLRVPAWFERIFWILFVPPSMHRIHHSVKIMERDTNYGTILSVWDRILGTLLKDIDQAGIVIGVGPYREPEKLGSPPAGHALYQTDR